MVVDHHLLDLQPRSVEGMGSIARTLLKVVWPLIES